MVFNWTFDLQVGTASRYSSILGTYNQFFSSTGNFLCVIIFSQLISPLLQEYESVHSDPITVVARDLGTSVLRSKVLKNDGGTRRRSQFKYSVVDTLVESSQICDNIRRDDTADSNHSTSRSTNDFASRNIIISRASMESTNTDKETDDSFSVVVDEESVKDQKQGDSEEEIQFLDCRYELADDGVTHLTPISSLTENCILDGSHARGNSKPEIKTSLGKNVVEYNKEQYLDPNEPVYIGSKSYPPQFTFWQVGSFHSLKLRLVYSVSLFLVDWLV